MPLTAKQREQALLLQTKPNVLCVGGARSGKTYGILYWDVVASLAFPKLRSLIARRYATDVRNSIWADTLQKVLLHLDLHDGSDYTRNEQQMSVEFANGSRIQCAGLDDKERVDKILGQEFGLIYINECQDIVWPTVRTLYTRLSQNIKNFTNQFVCDLNPQGINHWSYKLFVEGVNPEDNKPLPEARRSQYAWIKMNPSDNAENLPEGYITNNLESLSGNARKRFLDGEFQSNDDIMVFSPPRYYTWEDFMAWGEDKWPSVQFAGGLDLGFQDADAFCVIAYREGDPIRWLIYELKVRRKSLEELANLIKDGLSWVWKNVPNRVKNFDIWSDMATIHHGKEGDSKKNAADLVRMYDLPCRPAYKQDKKLSIELLADAITAGEFRILQGGPMHSECLQTVWTRLDDGTIMRVLDHETFHPDMLDAVRYAERFLYAYGNACLADKEGVKTYIEGNQDQLRSFETKALDRMRSLTNLGGYF